MGNYHVVQHHYWDESCTAPKYTVSAKGRIRLGPESFVAAGATTAEYRSTLITVTPHDPRAATEFDIIMETECPGKN